MMKERIITKKDEYSYNTSDPARMLNRYLTKNVYKTWTEDFLDEDTGNIVSIERNELLFQKGDYIDQNLLAKIRFSIQAEEIQEVEVSNQKRLAFECENKSLFPFVCNVELRDKKLKLLLYASSIINVLDIAKDYIELNYSGSFFFKGVKEFDHCVILEDTLKRVEVDDFEDEEEIEETETKDKKFYKLDLKISYDEENNDNTWPFIVHTTDVDRAMILIEKYLAEREIQVKMDAVNHDRTYNIRTFHLTIEKAAPVPFTKYIPKEFSQAYN